MRASSHRICDWYPCNIKVKYSYAVNVENVLSLNEGDKVVVVKYSDDWTYCRDDEHGGIVGLHGIFVTV